MNSKKTLAILSAICMLHTNVYADTSYKVQKGDTYWLLSQRFGTSLSSILQANGATASSELSVGQIIRVPSNTYTVQKGETYYLIAQKCGVTLDALLKANGATYNSVLNIGDIIKIPDSGSSYIYHTVQKGDTYWTISQQYNVALSSVLSANNATADSVLYVGESVKVPKRSSGSSENNSSGNSSTGASVTYSTYYVKSGDTLWNIAIKHGIPYDELLKTNSLSESSYVYTGMKLTIPVHHVPVKNTPSAKHGELLDWYTEAQYVVPINTDFTITDFSTGLSFRARRTIGSGHADCEPLTAADTEIMKKIWGGSLNWNKRSVLIYVNGRKIAASATSAMHAGNDWDAGGVWTSWRSGNYGAGLNYDYVKGNGADGHFDLYFYNSIGHSSGTLNSGHQSNVLSAAGKK